MISYELAKQLKDNGFRQLWNSGRYYYLDDIGYKVAFDYIKGATLENGQLISYVETLVMIPTLSELIEACGKYICLEQLTDGWICYSNEQDFGSPVVLDAIDTFMCLHGYGSTPEEAVAKLYLALNEK